MFRVALQRWIVSLVTCGSLASCTAPEGESARDAAGSSPAAAMDAPTRVDVGTDPAATPDPAAPGTVDPSLPAFAPAPPPGFGTGAYAGTPAIAPDAPTDAGSSPTGPEDARSSPRPEPTDARGATGDPSFGGMSPDGGFQACRPALACAPEEHTCMSLPCIGQVTRVYSCRCVNGRYRCTSVVCTDGGM